MDEDPCVGHEKHNYADDSILAVFLYTFIHTICTHSIICVNTSRNICTKTHFVKFTIILLHIQPFICGLGKN